MKIPVSTILSAVSILEKLDITSMKLSTAYKVSKVLDESKKAIANFETQRLDLAKMHGKLDKEGEQYLFSTAKAKKAFNEAMETLLSDEIDIDVKKIHIDLLDDVFDVIPQQIPFVEWFVDGLE